MVHGLVVSQALLTAVGHIDTQSLLHSMAVLIQWEPHHRTSVLLVHKVRTDQIAAPHDGTRHIAASSAGHVTGPGTGPSFRGRTIA